jgi:small-conductance mechanosensitive channel
MVGDMQAQSMASPQELQGHSAQVVVDGIPLFQIVGTSTFPAKRRAREIDRRIKQLAADMDFDPTALQLRDVEGATGIYAGDEVLMYVFKEDAYLEGALSPRLIAQKIYLPKIATAIYNYRFEREPKVLLKHGLYAVLRTVLLFLCVWGVIWGFQKIHSLVEQRFKKKIDELEEKSKKILQARQLWTIVKTLLNITRGALLLILVYLFITLVLDLFPWTRYIARPLLGYLINPLVIIGRALLDYLPNLFFLVILVALLKLLLKLTRTFFAEINRGNISIPGFYTDWAWPTYRIVRVIVVIIGAVVAYPYIPGSGSEAFKGITLLLGVLLSLGSTSLIANILAGYTMTYRRAFTVGDLVRIDGNLGEITEIRLLVTRMRSLKNEEIIIPNSTILNGEVVNYSSMITENELIFHTSVGIGYEVPWRQVEALLLAAAEQTEGLLDQPRPFVLKQELGDFGVTYELNAFSDSAEQMPRIYSDLHGHILDVFNEHGVAIMTPHYTSDPVAPKIVHQNEQYIHLAQKEQTEDPT